MESVPIRIENPVSMAAASGSASEMNDKMSYVERRSTKKFENLGYNYNTYAIVAWVSGTGRGCSIKR